LLDSESKTIYKNTRLHRDLRDEILTRHERRKGMFLTRAYKPAAAILSLVLIVSAIVLPMLRTEAGIYVGGEPITARPIGVIPEKVSYADGLMRTALYDPSSEQDSPPLQTAGQCAALEIRFGKDVWIHVDGGMLLIPDSDGNPTFSAQSGIAPDKSTVYWSFSDCAADLPLRAQITDSDGTVLAALTLTYDAEAAEWLLSADKIRS